MLLPAYLPVCLRPKVLWAKRAFRHPIDVARLRKLSAAVAECSWRRLTAAAQTAAGSRKRRARARSTNIRDRPHVIRRMHPQIHVARGLNSIERSILSLVSSPRESVLFDTSTFSLWHKLVKDRRSADKLYQSIYIYIKNYVCKL